MTSGNPTPELKAELADLRVRLAEAEETLRAIHAGEVDALVIAGKQGDEVKLLGAGDHIYRQFIEAISEGTATLTAGGEILSCNDCLAKTLRRPPCCTVPGRRRFFAWCLQTWRKSSRQRMNSPARRTSWPP